MKIRGQIYVIIAVIFGCIVAKADENGKTWFRTSTYNSFNFTGIYHEDNIMDEYDECINGLSLILGCEPSSEIELPDCALNSGKEDIVVGITPYFFELDEYRDIPQKIKFGRYMTYIDMLTFENCRSLREINLEKIERIGMYAFKNCSSLKEVNVEGLNSEDGVIRIYSTAFEGCTSLEKVSLGSSTSKILFMPRYDTLNEGNMYEFSWSVFKDSENLREVSINNSVETEAFYYYNKICDDYMLYSDGIHPDVFGPAPSVTTLSVDNLETLSCTAYSPLESMVAVKNLRLGENMKALDLHRFIKVGGVRNIEVLAKEPPVLKIDEENMFNYADCYLTVPEESVELYRKADVWREFATINGMSNVVNVEAETATPRYYNLQGVEVANPTNGLYIKVAGNKATKVVL